MIQSYKLPTGPVRINHREDTYGVFHDYEIDAWTVDPNGRPVYGVGTLLAHPYILEPTRVWVSWDNVRFIIPIPQIELDALKVQNDLPPKTEPELPDHLDVV